MQNFIIQDEGDELYQFAKDLFPICRSLTGEGVRKTLRQIQSFLPGLTVHEVPSGTECFDWTVPKEWNIRDAYILDPDGQKIISFESSNLHVLGYSIPIDKTISLEELQDHLYSLPDQETAIPYMTSYYKERWGFCMSHQQRLSLKEGNYRVYIDSSLEPGHLTYGELLIKGRISDEIFLSTYVCHPSMANNEISGPVVTTFLAKWLSSQLDPLYSYRVIFIPETIGSIVYLSKNLQKMKNDIVAGFNITCIGDERAYSYLPSRRGGTLADIAALHVLKHIAPQFISYSFSQRGSDERQYCSPGVDLPIATIMRSKFGEYPEYHTSLDNIDFITKNGLNGGLELLKRIVASIEANHTYKVTTLCEPQLGKRGLYPTLSTKESKNIVKNMMDVLAFSDGTADLLSIAETINVPIWEIHPIAERLLEENLLEIMPKSLTEDSGNKKSC